MTERLTSLREELTRARAETDDLFERISPAALYSRPVPDRHRLIFYLGHVEAFDWNLLARKLSGKDSFHSTFDALFERGIDPEPGKATIDDPSDWPGETEVLDYRSRTRRWIDEHLDTMDSRILQMAIEHRYMHAETFAYLMHNLPYGEKRAAIQWIAEPDRPSPVNHIVAVPAGEAEMGTSSDQFGWDNEYTSHTVTVAAFRISKFKVSNGEYLKFVNEADGSPSHFWQRDGNRWLLRGMFGLLPLPMDFPVWVTWSQANAYAMWRGLQLPTEAQFQRASALSAVDSTQNNFGSHRFDPVPVDKGDGAGSVPHQTVGNGWEWTRDVFAPFAGFEPHPYYAGYSADFFDNQHYVMKGASPRTAALLARPGFRNWFRPEYPHVYAGFRVVED